MDKRPPRLAGWLLHRFLRSDLAEEVSGDLYEKFNERFRKKTLLAAQVRYWYEVLNYLRPFALKKHRQSNSRRMYRNYMRSAFRSLTKSKLLAAINITGLSIGMAVALAISLWIWDEISFDHVHKNHQRIAQVIQNVINNGEVQTWGQVPWPLGDEIRKSYGSDFQRVALTTFSYSQLLTTENKKLNYAGIFAEPGFEKIFSLEMLEGNGESLKDASSLLLSESAAKAYFGNESPLGKTMRLADQYTVSVAGIYRDFVSNSTFAGVDFIAAWDMQLDRLKAMDEPWRPNMFQLYVQLNDNADFKTASLKIRDAKLRRINEQLAKKKPALFLQPMDQWHLYAEFNNGKNIGGRIAYVWLFGIIGVFVLLMACINFMNLTTARSEQRAKEIGIRKTIGSLRGQLILQFFFESMLVAGLSLILSVLLVQLALPSFNQLTEKQMHIPFENFIFWIFAGGFAFLTGIVSGSYPAFHLSAIQPGKALKGAYRAGKMAGLSRKGLVILQFSISMILIVGTVTVFRQIKFAQDRPIGYDRNALITVPVVGKQIHEHFDAFRKQVESTSAVIATAEASGLPTEKRGSSSGFEWRGKDPSLSVDFNFFGGSVDYGRTVGWEVVAGRDFSPSVLSDSSAIIINEAAAHYMGFKEPVGEIVRWFGEPETVIGVIRDIVVGSPYEPVGPCVYYRNRQQGNVITLRLNQDKSVSAAIAHIGEVFKQFVPDEPFSYSFIDEEYAKKFGNENRIGTLAAVFTILATIISCLGIFALSSFEAEQRTKEIGIRKVLGATVIQLWGMLSGKFLTLVLISCVVATPIAWYGLNFWLSRFNYRTGFPWWIMATACIGTLGITLLTVSYYTLYAANVKPAKSLRTE